MNLLRCKLKDECCSAGQEVFGLVCISIQLLQNRGYVDQTELTTEVADYSGIVQNQELPYALALAALAQVHGLQKVPVIQVPERHTSLTSRHK